MEKRLSASKKNATEIWFNGSSYSYPSDPYPRLVHDLRAAADQKGKVSRCAGSLAVRSAVVALITGGGISAVDEGRAKCCSDRTEELVLLWFVCLATLSVPVVA